MTFYELATNPEDGIYSVPSVPASLVVERGHVIRVPNEADILPDMEVIIKQD